MKISKILLLVAFVGLLCSVSGHQLDFSKAPNTLMGALPKVVGIGALAADMVTITPDDESIQEVVDEIATEGTIYLSPGRYSKAGDWNVNISSKDISIVALDDGVVIDAGEQGRLFNIDKDSKISMEKLSLYNGQVSGDGACINNAGDLNIINCNISKNTAYKDDDSTGYAGAIHNTGNCKINNSFLSSDEAQNGGGAIANFGTCAVANSEITNITSWSNGGVFYNTGNFTVSNTNIYKNTAYKNGGIVWNSGNFTSVATEFSKSVATKSPFEDSELLGGGVLYNKGGANIINSTLKNCSIRYNAVGNQVGGGAIVSDSGSTLNISGSILDNHRNIAVVILNNSKFNMEYSTIQNSDGAFNSKSSAVVRGCKFINNTAASKEENSNGGAINSAGNVNIVDSVFDNNVAGSGGAIYSTVVLNIVDSNFTSNKATDGGYYYGGGGAIKNLGTLTISSSNFNNNQAKSSVNSGEVNRGGAIATSNDTEITGSKFIANKADSVNSRGGGDGSGGAIKTWNKCKFLVKDSLFDSNSASYRGGAIDFDDSITREGRSTDAIAQGTKLDANLVNVNFNNNNAKVGGAVELCNGVLSATGVKFTGNSASGQGGALDIRGVDYSSSFNILDANGKHFTDFFMGNSAGLGKSVLIYMGQYLNPGFICDEGVNSGEILKDYYSTWK
ncbi:MAG: conserved hypothetical protein [Methanobrevibacter sp. CfCl-M3]